MKMKSTKHKNIIQKMLILMLILILSASYMPNVLPKESIYVEAAPTSGYSAVFNSTYYANRYIDLKRAFGYNEMALFSHFLNYGMKEGRQASEEFNVQVYKERYADLRDAFGDDLPSYYMHYINCGKREGRNARTESAPVSNQEQNEDTLNRPLESVTEAEVRAYYDKAVFVGDSIMEGYRNYALSTTASIANQSDFLAIKNFTTTMANNPTANASRQPMYQGEHREVWESIALMDVDKVFLMFGTNDLVVHNPERTFNDYMTLINKIRERNPNVEIHIISMTPTSRSCNKGSLNRDGVITLNSYLQANQLDYSYGYVDVHSALADAEGYLSSELCSDGEVHQKRSAYSGPWDSTLYDYAVHKICQ